MSQQLKPIYEFGPYRLDTAERLLTRDGEVSRFNTKSSICCRRWSSVTGACWKKMS